MNGAPTLTTAAPADILVPATRTLTTADRCDQCGAAAYVRAEFTTGELMFCGHHFLAGLPGIQNQAVKITDERAFITG